MKLFCCFYRLWICTFTLAVSGGAVLLLPMSIVANEVLLIYPKSYYLQWVNTSLIQGQYRRRYSGLKTYIGIVTIRSLLILALFTVCKTQCISSFIFLFSEI